MSFAEAKAFLKKNPGAVLTRDSTGDHIVKNKQGELLYSPTLPSRSDQVGNSNQPEGKEPAAKVKKRLLGNRSFQTVIAFLITSIWVEPKN